VSYNITDVREMSHANRTVVQFICWTYCSIHANAVKLNNTELWLEENEFKIKKLTRSKRKTNLR